MPDLGTPQEFDKDQQELLLDSISSDGQEENDSLANDIVNSWEDQLCS